MVLKYTSFVHLVKLTVFSWAIEERGNLSIENSLTVKELKFTEPPSQGKKHILAFKQLNPVFSCLSVN